MKHTRRNQRLALATALIAGVATAHAEETAADQQRLRQIVVQHADVLATQPGDNFENQSTMIDADGTRHERVRRTYMGLPVIGGDMVIHSRKEQFTGASMAMSSSLRPKLVPQLSTDQAQLKARAHFDGRVDSIETHGLVIYAHDTHPRLAYELRVRGVSRTKGRANMRYFVDANDGAILNSWNLYHTVQGKARTLLHGEVPVESMKLSNGYLLIDPYRGGNAVFDGRDLSDMFDNYKQAQIFFNKDNHWGDHTTAHRATIAGDVAYGTAATWDYYLQTHGRRGIFNDGRGVFSYVHVVNKNDDGSISTNFAQWNGRSVEYGGGSRPGRYPYVSLDVIGHEITHGVTQYTAELAYEGESGGLNEATSDIFGTMIERFAKHPMDKPDYLIGEQTFVEHGQTRGALRAMFKPSLDGDSPDCWDSTLGSLDVHNSSGVGNHFFYLLAEGAAVPTGLGPGTPTNLSSQDLVCNGNIHLQAIGPDRAARIWYRALTVYMTSNTNYARARMATLQAATDLHGADSREVKAVAAAWSAVNVN